MLRKLAIILGVLLGLAVLLVAGAFGLAQTRFGQDRLAALIARQLGTPEQPAEVEGLSGFLPFDMRLALLRLRDPQGVWLEVEDASLRIRERFVRYDDAWRVIEHGGPQAVLAYAHNLRPGVIDAGTGGAGRRQKDDGDTFGLVYIRQCRRPQVDVQVNVAFDD